MFSAIINFKPWLGLASVVLMLHGCAFFQSTPVTTDPPAADSSAGFDTAIYHTVQPGETLHTIAAMYGHPVEDVAAWNNIVPPYSLAVGQQLLVSIPSSATTEPTPIDVTPAPVIVEPAPVDTTPIEVTPVIVDVPVSTPATSGDADYHLVQHGDTLYSISRRYGYSVTDIASWNSLYPPYTLAIGQQLRVSPFGGVSNTPSVVYTPPTSTTTTSGQTYIVQSGDTLYSIARRYGYSVADIASWNGLYPPYTLSVGQRLIVSPSGGASYSTPAPTTTTVSTGSSYHTVQRGDTLYSIARRYGYSVAEIAAWNNLHSPYTLSVGQRLIVSSAGGTTRAAMYNYSEPRPEPMRVVSLQSQASPVVLHQSVQAAYDEPRPEPMRVTTLSTQSVPLQSVSNNQSRTSTYPHYHIVQEGETLAGIAQHYGITSHSLSIWNGIGRPYTVYPGQKLLIVAP